MTSFQPVLGCPYSCQPHRVKADNLAVAVISLTPSHDFSLSLSILAGVHQPRVASLPRHAPTASSPLPSGSNSTTVFLQLGFFRPASETFVNSLYVATSFLAATTGILQKDVKSRNIPCLCFNDGGTMCDND
ncbi:hypothetical protein ACS0TY_005929 [Phlomoides rotata]